MMTRFIGPYLRLTLPQAYWGFLLFSLFNIGITLPSQAQWMAATSGTTANLNGVTNQNGLWVTVGDNGKILTSPNGITWTPRTSGVTVKLSSVKSNGSLLVAVGDVGTILTSVDGITWVIRQQQVSYQTITCVNYGGGQWVAGGFQRLILTSPDGITWTQRYLNIATSGAYWSLYNLSYGGGQWIGVGGLLIATSPDALNWYDHSLANNSVWYDQGIYYNNGLWVSAGGNSSIVTSGDGINWTVRNLGANKQLYDVIFANGQWTAVGEGGTILTSPNGITWTSSTSNTTIQLNSVSFGGARWVTVGEGGTILYTPEVALPVSLISFQGQVISTTAHLSWQTAWETDASHFLIERSSDANHFEAIGRIQAQGTTSQMQSYAFVDDNLPSGLWYYRLRQVDRNGSVTYSKIIALRMGSDDLAQLSAYPNPGRGPLVLEAQGGGIREVTIYQAKGNPVYQQRFGTAVQKWSWDGADQPAGVYLVRVEGTGGQLRSLRWVKQ